MNILGNSENITINFAVPENPSVRYKKLPIWMMSVDVNANRHDEFMAKCLHGIHLAGIKPSTIYIAAVSKLVDFLYDHVDAEYLPELEWSMKDAEELARGVAFDRSDKHQTDILEAYLAVWINYLLNTISCTFYITEVKAGDLVRNARFYVMRRRDFDIVQIELCRPKK